MITRRILPLVGLLAALALTACGGSSQPSAKDAQTAYAPIRVQVLALGTDVGAAITGASRSTDVALASAFAALAARDRAVLARLDALKLPDPLVAKRNALRDALAKGEGDLGDIATAARAHDAAAARSAAEQLVADSEQIRSARTAFEQALSSAAR